MVTRRAPSGSLAAIGCALALAACGSSSKPSAATAAKSDVALKLAQCMRAHGVPSFPDPGPGGSLEITRASGIDPQAPAFRAAQQACMRYMPGVGHRPGPVSARERRRALAFAQCMRAHGESDFPDPTIGAPNPGTTGRALVLQGMFFAVAPNFDPKTPGFRRAAAACGLAVP